MENKVFLSEKFVSAKQGLNTITRHVPAPYIRKTFDAKKGIARLTVTATGFYRAFVNGKEITRSILAPYMTNPNHYMFYDTYEIELVDGKNAVGFILGNGLANSLDYNVWAFEKASFRSVPKVAFAVETGETVVEADGAKTYPSPVTFDDLHAGEYYDKRLEIADFSCPSYCDDDWQETVEASAPQGEKVLSTVPPIVTEKELKAVSVKPCDGGYVYDFGYTSAGNMRLKLHNATEGQKVRYVHTEVTKNGKPIIDTLVCGRMKTNQTFEYTAKGLEEEVYEPFFTFVGCRYVFVTGITEEQATKDLFTFKIMHAAVSETGFFRCSDIVANKIEGIVKNSDKSNLFYYPTDCPHREKNGWTGDASLSCEHYLANFDVRKNFETWLMLVRKAQRADGALPGIVPTDTWGFVWGNGPCWDKVLIELPYQIYRLYGDKRVINDNADCIYKYLKYTQKKLNPEGLADFGLAGDWVQPYCLAPFPYAPRKVTNTLSLIDTCQKARKMFLAIGDTEKADFCKKYGEKLKERFRRVLVNPHTLRVRGNCQTSQAGAIFCGIFTEAEKAKAGAVLVGIIKRDGYTLNTGFYGTRVLLHALDMIGQNELAYKLITQTNYPSYGYMISVGSTSLWETFEKVEVASNGDIYRRNVYPHPSQAPNFVRAIHFAWMRFCNKLNPKREIGRVSSLNHHAFGDVSNYFKRVVCGLRVNDSCTDVQRVDVKPFFVSTLSFAEASRKVDGGVIFVRWTRKKGKVELVCDVPQGLHGSVFAPEGYAFENGATEMELKTGKYIFCKE